MLAGVRARVLTAASARDAVKELAGPSPASAWNSATLHDAWVLLGAISGRLKRTGGALITTIGAIHISGSTSIGERHRSWSWIQLVQIGPSQGEPMSWASPVKLRLKL